MSVDLRITESDWMQLRAHFASSFRVRMAAETGALAILGECKTTAKREFIVVKVLLPGPGDLKIASTGEVVFGSTYIRRAHLEMRTENLAGIAIFHTHPFADAMVDFSPYDNQQEPMLAENLTELDPRTRLISVVAGKQSQCGRFYFGGNTPASLAELIVVGDHLSYLALDGGPPAAPPTPSAIFDRGQALTSAGALNRLSRMTVVVVGASGTGSLFCELLARAGCNRIIVIDPDIVKDINLNRILYATVEDLRHRTPKVEVLRRGIEGLGLDCEILPVQGSILDRDVLRYVLDGDLVVGCVDRDLPRHLLCEISFRYLLPYVDVGSEIGGDDNGIVSVDSRVSYVAPDRYCLMCSGVVSPRRLNFESLTETERQRKIALGYSDDLLMSQPAVMDLNMRASSSGMLLVRHLLQPFLQDPFPVKLCENAIVYKSRPVSTAAKMNANCPTCQVNRYFGYGDCGSSIGFDPETAKGIFGNESNVATTLPKPGPVDQIVGAPHFLDRIVRRLFG